MFRKILASYLVFYLLFTAVIPVGTVQAQDDITHHIAVYDLSAEGIPLSEAKVISERFRTFISQELMSEKYRSMKDKIQYDVLERSQMDKLMAQFELQQTGCISDSCYIEIGRLLAVDRIVVGSIGLVGRTYLVSARIIDVESGKYVSTADGQLKGSIDNVFSSVIPKVGNELLYGKKKPRRLYYILAGVLIAAGAGAAAALGGDDGGESNPLPMPPDRP